MNVAQFFLALWCLMAWGLRAVNRGDEKLHHVLAICFSGAVCMVLLMLTGIHIFKLLGN